MDGIEGANKKSLEAFIGDYLPPRYLKYSLNLRAKHLKVNIPTDAFLISASSGKHGNIRRQANSMKSRFQQLQRCQMQTSTPALI
jgi:hypothetical protein